MNAFKLFVLAACGAALVGCGGGSGGPAAAVQADLVAPPPPVQKLTIHGAVIDDPIDTASVSFRVGERHYEASRPSDANGAFSVEIEYDSVDDLVYGQALRSATGIHFVGDVMTVGELLEKARNGVVNGARITNLTTAKFVLAAHSTADGAIDSYGEFMAASRGVDAEKLVEVGAAIKAVVESIDGTVLPADIRDTLDLAEKIVAGATSFVGDLNVASPATMRASIAKMLTDGYATEDFDPARVPGVYMSTTSLTAYALFADGSGLVNFFDDRDIERVRDWRVNADGDLELDYTAGDGRGDLLQILSDTGAALQINQVRGVPSGAGDAYEVANFEYYAFEGRFKNEEAPGRYANLDGSGGDFVLSVGGRGYLLDASGTPAGTLLWNVAGDGRLVLSLPSGSKTVLTRLAGEGDALRVLSLTTRVGGAVERMLVQTYTRG